MSANEDVTNALNALADRFSEYVAAERGLITNDVARSETVVFGANGFVRRAFSVAVASVTVFNESTTTVLVTNGAGTPGRVGIGQFAVRAGTWKTVPLVGAAITLYGRPGETVGLVAFTKPTPAAAGALGDSPYFIVPAGVSTPVAASGIVYTHPWQSAGVHAVYAGFQFRETAGALAQARFWDGGTSGKLLDEIEVGASSTVLLEYDNGFDVATGQLYLELVAGALSGTVRVR